MARARGRPPPLTVAEAIAPTGAWGKVWLAAHWDKKLKKEDFIEANISDLVDSILRSSEKLTLRYMGNFLLGLCKLYAKQSFYFEEHGRELHDNLMLAFSMKDESENKRRARAPGGAAEARAAASEAASEAMVFDEELERVLASRKHLAQLEDITLKPLMDDPLALGDGMQLDTFGATSAGDKAALLALTKRTKRAFLGQALPIMDASDTLAPLVDIPQEVSGVGGLDADPLGNIDMDLDPLAIGEDGNIDMRGLEPLEDDQDGVGGGPGDEPSGKRRRKAFQFDDPAEIPKEVYQGYMNDRSAITKKSEYDSTILLPHNHPSMPQFMTTYTDMCNSLIQGLSWGSQVAERRRTVMAMAEASAPGASFPGPMWTEAPGSGPDASSMPGGDFVLEQPMVPLEVTGRWEPAAAPIDLSDAPTHMSAVIQSVADEEEASASQQEARVGYSGRTEKMHKFLAKEFQKPTRATTPTLSYEQICRSQSGGDRGVIAGCFFELLVLRTNGVVNLRQEEPYADIRIEKAKSWGTTS